MNITRGKIPCAKKVVCYGPEGIGKSTFASKFPDPLFIDTEGSTKDMDVARLPVPSSWTMLEDEIKYVKQHPDSCKTLVIDTVDWAEQLCVEHICDKHQKSGIEDFGYGNGYVYVKEEFGRFLNLLTDVIDVGINVVLTAHAQIRKFEQPDELGAYDRYELKLGKKTSSQTSPLVKEWSDMLLFANYKTYSVAVDDKGKKHKAQGGTRVMYTTHHPCWDAKNRYGLPDEVPFDYASIAHIIGNRPIEQKPPAPQAEKKEEEPISNQTPPAESVTTEPKTEPPAQPEGNPPTPESQSDPVMPPPQQQKSTVNEKIPKALRDLMIENHVEEWDIQEVVAAKGYYPSDTPIENYDQKFINGVLVGAWKGVYAAVQEMKKNEKIPFN